MAFPNTNNSALTEYFIHYLKFEMWTAWFYVSYLIYLFWTVKLKLGQDFSQFIHTFKIGIFCVLILGCISKFFQIHKEILGFLNVAFSGLCNFTQFMTKMENCISWISAFATLPNFSQFTKEKLGFLSSHWFHILIGCEESLSGTGMFVKERGGPNLWLNCLFSRETNVYIYLTILCQFKCWKYCFQA